MKVDFSTILVDFDGKAIPDVQSDQTALIDASRVAAKLKLPLADALMQAAQALDGSADKPLTLKDVCIRSIQAGVQKDSAQANVIALFELGMALKPSGQIELTTEQATILKELVPLVFKSPLLSGQACKLLNG